MYIYIYIYIHIHTYIHIHLHIQITHTYVYIYIYTHMSDQRRARPSMMYEGPFALYDEPMESCTDTYICIYIIERDTYIHIHMYIYIYREREMHVYIYIYADIGVIDTIGAQDPPCQCCRHIYIYIYTLEHGLFEAWPHDLARSRGYVFAHRSHSEFK